MNRLLPPIFAVAALFVAPGCASSTDKASTQKEVPIVIIPAVTTRPVAASTGAPNGAMYLGQPQPVAVQEATSGVPVYTEPKITKTVLAPYEDEKGRIYGPQVMYEKVTEGKFNPDALQNPEMAYIPQENLVVPPGMGNPASAIAMAHAQTEAPRLPTDYIDPRDVVVTGLLGKEANRAEANRMAAAAGRRASFDPDIGWILVPVSVVK